MVHCGPAGAGHVARLINNALDASNRMITYEMAAMAVKQGLQTAVMDAVTNGKGSGRSDASERIVPALGSDRQTTRVPLRHTLDELTRVFQLAVSCGAPLFLANVVRSLVEAGVNQTGENATVDDLARLYETMGGFRFAAP